ncbi:MAG TPA: cytochrome P450 [Solirubrobacteraceae bacterium]|nr:cytochrome P450 [Solirubrobacteraceae bacterium]
MAPPTDQITADRPESAPVVDFDLSTHNSMQSSNAAWDALRTAAPVAWSDDNGGAWIVSSYEAVTTAFRNTDAFKSGRAVRGRPGPGADPGLMPINAVPTKTTSLMIPEELDAPLWHPYRRVFAHLLSPRGVEALRPRITYWVTRLLDDVIESGHCDIVGTLTSGVPGAVILEWLGFPEQDWHRLSAAFHNMASYVEGTPDAQHYLDELEWTFQRIREEVTAVRDEPRDDIASFLANTVVAGERTSYEFATGMVNMAMSGGVDTTTSVASAAFVHLHRHPGDRQRLIDEPELIDSAVEEFLRVYPPARTHARTVVQDTEIGGFTLRKDDRLIISEVSACHDEAAFPDADKFIIDRFPNRHVAFGLGPHRCPGSHVARAMFKEMLVQVLERIPDYQIVEDELDEYPNWTALGGWSRAPITFTPGTRRL